MGRHVIVGAGTIGSALAVRLAEAGHEVTVVSRRGAGPTTPGIHAVALDAGDERGLRSVAGNADVLYNCANPTSYGRWARDWPPVAASVLGTAVGTGAVLVTLSNLYGYGFVPRAICEDDPLAATSTKGRVRAAMWADAKTAHDAGDLRATEVRASDFFGPGITSTGVLGDRVVPKILDHETIGLLGDLDAPHSWSFVDDVARALEVAGRDERAWGRAWHAPTAAPRSPREAVDALAAAAGLPTPAVRRVPWSVVRAAGLVVHQLRGLHEIAYQFDEPFVVDSTAFTDTFGVCPTPFGEACAATVAWWRRRRGFPLPSLADASSSMR
ncbi:MAG TPA: NAD-dependent epimerase/dehydratase family protein [Acidimicrobiales bacterium]|jgi:nucleoside-diphosphate-sugar epimerase|nr:NAD-dependent epimerase/dehydratase family protein [Acidimicrobiales bacterium]